MAHPRMIRIAQIGQTLLDTQFESRYDDLLEELAAELLVLSGVCSICSGSGEDEGEGDPCPGCGGSGNETPSPDCI